MWSNSLWKNYQLAKARLTISFVGLDGAGKGTYIALLEQKYKREGINYKCCYMGFGSDNQPVVKWIKSLMLKEENKKILRHKILMILYMALLPFDFLVRRGFGVCDVLITDRHPRYEPVTRKGFFVLYNQLIEKICPAPDLVIYLTGNVETIWERKKELDIRQYVHKKKILDNIIKMNKKKVTICKINTDRKISEVFNQILLKINEHTRDNI